MAVSKLKLAALGLVAAIGLGGCTDGYGYSGVSVGYGGGGYGYDGYDDYGYGGYGNGYYGAGYGGLGGYGGGFGNSYYGWYGDYYYPGTGYYVYDRDRRRHRWNDTQRRYWEGRRGNGRPNGTWQGRPDRDGRPGYGRPAGDGQPGYGQGRPGRGDQAGRGPNRGNWTGFNRDPRQGQAFQGNRGVRPSFQPGATRPDRAQVRPDRGGDRQFSRPQGRQDRSAIRGGGRRSERAD
jgi:hypothetical protein